MKNRPVIKIKLTWIDKIIELLSFLTIIIVWIMVFIKHKEFPDMIPTHFDLKGKADLVGSKDNLLTLQSVLTFLFIGMTLLTYFPHKLSYAVQITKRNVKLQYRLAVRLIRVLKLVLVFVFGLLFFKTIQNAQGYDSEFRIFFLPYFIVSIIFIVAIYLIKSIRNK